MDREITQKEKNIARRRVIIRISIVLCIIIGALIALIAFLSPSVLLRDLTLSTADSGTLEVSVMANGQVVPAYEEIINSPINTRIEQVLAKVGDSVEIGTPLLKLDLQSTMTDYGKMQDEEKMKILQLEKFKTDTRSRLSEMDMKLKVSKMELNLKAAELNSERYLDSLGSGTTDKVKQVELAYRTSQLQLEQDELKYRNEVTNSELECQIKELELNNYRKSMLEARRTLNDAELRSPRRAVLTFLTTEIGSQITQGQKVAVISDLSTYKITGEVADAYGSKLSVGAQSLVKIGSETLNGIVSEIAPQSKSGMINFTVRLMDEYNRKLRSGLRGDIYIFTSIKENVVRIGLGSFYRGSGEYELFVVDGGDLVRRRVILGDSSSEHIEVKEGIKPGEQVVISDMSKYVNNKKLKLNK